MYRIKHNPPAPAPLDFNTPRRTDSVADALGPDTGPHDESPVPTLDTAALLSELGLSDRAVRSILTSRPASEL